MIPLRFIGWVILVLLLLGVGWGYQQPEIAQQLVNVWIFCTN